MVTAKDKLRTLLGNGLDYGERPRHRLLVGEGRQGDAGGERHRRRARASSACRCRRSIRPSCRNSSSRPASSSSRRERPDLMYLSTTDYMQHKAAPGSDDRECLLRHDGPLCRRARRAGLRARADRRSRHERQASAERRARRHLSAGRCSTTGSARARRGSSCRSPTPMSRITARSAPSPRSICRQDADAGAMLDRARAPSRASRSR